MANRNWSTINYTLEKNTVTLYAKVTFDSSGAPILDSVSSKGIANFWKESIPLTGGVVNSTTIIGTVTSFSGLFTGMTISGSGVATTNLISSMSASGDTITMTKQNITTADGVALQASGGRYRVQFGRQISSATSIAQLDTYNKLLDVSASWDMTSGSATGTMTTLQLAPNNYEVFVVSSSAFNNVTVPRTAVSGSTDASLALQFGFGKGVEFRTGDPVAGETVRLKFVFGNSTAG